MVDNYGLAFLSALMYTLISVGIAMPALRIISAWLIESAITAWSAVTALLLILGISAVCWFVGGPEWTLVFVIVLTISNLIHPWMSGWLDSATIGRMRGEDMQKYRRAIEQDPTNAAAHEYLADALMEIRRYDEAIAEYEIMLSLTPRPTVQEKWKLRQALSRKERRRPRADVICRQCDAANAPANAECLNCGAPLRKNYARALLLNLLSSAQNSGNASQLLRNIAIVLPLLFVVFAPLPVLAKIWILFAAAITGVYIVLKRVGGD